jgi:hypothetical protein
MKQLLGVDTPATITFNKTAGTITITNFNQALTKANMLLIVNATRNSIMLNFIDPSLSYTVSTVLIDNTMVTNVITFGYSTSSMADADVLQVYVDIEGIEVSLHAFLRRLVSLMESNAVVDSSGRQRIVIDQIATAAVTNTAGLGPSAVANTPGGNPYTSSSIPILTVSEGPVDQRWRIIDSTQTSYAVAMRTQLSWSA